MKVIAKTIYKEGYNLIWSTDFLDGYKPKAIQGTNLINDNDIQVKLETKRGKYLADAICHYGSYGVGKGLWEVMMENPPKSWGGGVRGHLSWIEVQKYFDLAIKKK